MSENHPNYALDTDARSQAPTFYEMVAMIEKLFKDYLKDIRKNALTGEQIEEGWQRYKTLNHLYQDEQPKPAGAPWVKANERLPEVVDKKCKAQFVKVEEKRRDGSLRIIKAVAYYFPEHFKTVEWEDWDGYSEEKFPYTESDEEKGVVWLKPGWYADVECDACDNSHWSAPLNVIEWLDESGTASNKDISEDAHEKEVMMQAFAKVVELFEKREWIMQGRGLYPYNDDRYKEEVRYLYDEFEAIRKDTWVNIKSKTFEYRQKIIEQYLKDNPSNNDAIEFAEFLDSERNNKSGNWKDMNIWGKENAFKAMLNIWQQPKEKEVKNA